jgi:N-acetylglucosamine-6-sulfatase
MVKDMGSFFNKRLTRREALRTLGTAAAMSFLLPGKDNHAFSAKARPNIVFILSDDHRWDALSCKGHPFIKTPNLDKLAAEGVLFENAFVTSSLCSPSRASFLTGQYAHTHGVKNNLTHWNDDNVTFLEILKGAGYDTAFIGKWHMPGRLPELRGVDRFITFTVQGGQGRYFDCPLIVDGKKVPSRKSYITEELTDYGIEFMAQKRNKPFCLFLSHKAVHHQFKPPPELDGLYDQEQLNLPKEADSWVAMTGGQIWAGVVGPIEPHYRNYCEAIVALDQQIGRVIGEIHRLGITDNTIIVYAGDNGYFWGEHHLVDKRWAYEESIRIPFIVRYPEIVENPGTTSRQMVLNIDVAPSLLDLAGIPVLNSMAGKSLLPILKNRKTAWRKAWLYEYFKDFPYNVPEMNAVRTEQYIYIDYEGRKKDELFNVASDPLETRNLMDTPEGRQALPGLKRMLEDLKKGKRL